MDFITSKDIQHFHYICKLNLIHLLKSWKNFKQSKKHLAKLVSLHNGILSTPVQISSRGGACKHSLFTTCIDWTDLPSSDCSCDCASPQSGRTADPGRGRARHEASEPGRPAPGSQPEGELGLGSRHWATGWTRGKVALVEAGSVLPSLTEKQGPVSVMHCLAYFWCAIIPRVHLLFRKTNTGHCWNLKWQGTRWQWRVAFEELRGTESCRVVHHSKIWKLSCFSPSCLDYKFVAVKGCYRRSHQSPWGWRLDRPAKTRQGVQATSPGSCLPGPACAPPLVSPELLLSGSRSQTSQHGIQVKRCLNGKVKTTFT